VEENGRCGSPCTTPESRVEQKLHRRVPESWTTTVPLKNVMHLLSNVEQTRLKLTPQRREQGTLFLVSMEALLELLHHSPTVARSRPGQLVVPSAPSRSSARRPPTPQPLLYVIYAARW
jgi:hypothetical protein